MNFQGAKRGRYLGTGFPFSERCLVLGEACPLPQATIKFITGTASLFGVAFADNRCEKVLT